MVCIQTMHNEGAWSSRLDYVDEGMTDKEYYLAWAFKLEGINAKDLRMVFRRQRD